MNIASMRVAVADAYPRRTWKDKVLHMSDEQVLAIYKSMERDGRLFDHVKSELKQQRKQNQMFWELQKSL